MSTDDGGIDDAQKCPSSNYLKSGESYNTQVYVKTDRAGNHEIISPKRDNRLKRTNIGSKGHFIEWNGESGRHVKAHSGPVYHYDKGGETRTTEGHQDTSVRKNHRRVVNGDYAQDLGGGRYSNAGKPRITGSDKNVLSYATTTNRRIAAGSQQGDMGSGTNVGQSNGDDFTGGKGHYGVSSYDAYQATTKDRTSMIGGNDNLEVQGDETKIIAKKDMKRDVGNEYTLTAQTKITLKVGQSMIEIEPSVITITSPKVITVGKTLLGSKSADTFVEAGDKLADVGGAEVMTLVKDPAPPD